MLVISLLVRLTLKTALNATQDASSPACHYEERLRTVHKLHRPASIALHRYSDFHAQRSCCYACRCESSVCSALCHIKATDGVLPLCTRCHTANPDDPGRCMFGTYLLPHVETPVFAFSSVFDGWMLQHVICNNEQAAIQAFGNALRQSILSMLHGTAHGAFLEDCRHHTKCWSDIEIDDTTPADAFSTWYNSLGAHEPGQIWTMTGEYGSQRCNRFSRELSCPVTTFRRYST